MDWLLLGRVLVFFKCVHISCKIDVMLWSSTLVAILVSIERQGAVRRCALTCLA